MFKRIIEALRSRAKPEYDPSVLNDRIALLTEWTPLVRGGANFKTHNLVQIYANRYEFRAGWGMKIFTSIFAIMGLTFALIAVGLSIKQENFPIAAGFFMGLFGLLFFAVGIGIYRYSSTPRVFDKDMGFY